jgi:hypothetical protein
MNNDSRALDSSLANPCHMVPEFEDALVIVAAFQRDDLVRLHTLLACYASPFRTGRERAERAAARVARRGRVGKFLYPNCQKVKWCRMNAEALLREAHLLVVSTSCTT